MVSDILTITLNPALDVSTSVPNVVAGPKLRCAVPTYDPGGGGINVSRSIKNLGGTSRAMVAYGGSTGQRLIELLSGEGIQIEGFDIPGETRESFAVSETSTNAQFRFVMPGPNWTPDMADAVLGRIKSLITPDTIVVISGSEPPGVPPDFPVALVETLKGHSKGVIVDTSGPALRYLFENPSGVDTLRMDAAEAVDLAGRQLTTRSDTADFAAEMVASGIANTVLVARGADGTILVSATEKLHCSRSIQRIVSAVGAGDSFVGGYTLAVSQGKSAPDALSCGVAAASAAVMTEATKLCTQVDAERLLPDCMLTRL